MEWNQEKYIEGNSYELPGTWLKLEYFEALNALFRIENSLRVFVYIILKNEFKDKWKDLSITSDDEESSTIGAIAKRRLAQDNNHAYLGYTVTSPLLYLTAGELIRIILSDKYWKLFRGYFLGSKDIIKSKLDEISKVRNTLAHFRPVKKGDVELIKQNALHVFTEIEKTIEDFIECPDVVPTNTSDIWYQELNKIKTDNCTLSFKQSTSEEWVRVTLSFQLPLLAERYKLKNSRALKTINLNVDKLIVDYPALAKGVICVTEALPSYYKEDTNNVVLVKHVRFTFGRKSLSQDYSEIKSEYVKALAQFNHELSLLIEDNLARGKLISVVNFSLSKQDNEKYFRISDRQVFETKFDKNTPVEFWGSVYLADNNFITGTDRFPWMPIDISKDNAAPF